MRVVTEADTRRPWLCAVPSCKAPFVVGDLAYGVPTYMYEDGDVIEGEYRCVTCWLNGEEVE
jgi:hypothetical protein